MVPGNDAKIDASPRKPAPSQIGFGRAEERTSPRPNQGHTPGVAACLVQLIGPKGARHLFPDLRGHCGDMHNLFQLGDHRLAPVLP